MHVGPKRSLVALVDDDESVRESVPDLLRELGFAAQAFESAEAFLASERIADVDCLVLDVFMPGMKGPELQRHLSDRGNRVPIVFITAKADEPTRTRVLDAGAAALLTKPFSEAALLEAIDGALRSR